MGCVICFLLACFEFAFQSFLGWICVCVGGGCLLPLKWSRVTWLYLGYACQDSPSLPLDFAFLRTLEALPSLLLTQGSISSGDFLPIITGKSPGKSLLGACIQSTTVAST
jgi:hypothetical protein